MQRLHSLNVLVHVLSGTIGLVIGLVALFYKNRSQQHSRYGRYFLYTLTVVVGTALLGVLLFRSSSFLIILTLLGGYVGYSGYRAVRLRESRSSMLDMLITLGVLLAGILYLLSMQRTSGNWSPSVVYSTLSALVLVAGYDLVKHFWLHERLKTWWLYEHIYKMLSAYSALLSAFSGTVLSQYKPYSQILPSVVCVLTIVYFIWQQVRKRSILTGLQPGRRSDKTGFYSTN
ncbi:hypothetical protein [Spirosoma telluris]|uniref:hypothetical protein n=1 Tax=Spirosoma telluris TaxID=2183553 RepID=UPI0018DB1457